jgi:tryptophan-rich sensory protein
LVKTAAGVAAAAATGSLAATPNSEWYRALNKPRWQPKAAVFPLVWTPLYGLIAVAGARTLDRLAGNDRIQFRRLYATDLVLNAAWTLIFFRARRPRLAALEIVALNVTNVVLLGKAWRSDRLAGLTLLPYVAWTGFATVLNGSLVARNPGRGRRGRRLRLR